jgi:hypothetical protein
MKAQAQAHLETPEQLFRLRQHPSLDGSLLNLCFEDIVDVLLVCHQTIHQSLQNM